MKFALRPLVFGSTKTTEPPPSVWACRPVCDRTLVLGKDRPEHRHADKRDDPRLKLPDLREQPLPSADIFFGRSSVSMPGVDRAMMLVTPNPHSGSRSSSWNVMRSGTSRDSIQQLPEPVGETREVMSGQRRSHAGVDADKQHVDARPDPIPQSPAASL